MKLDQINRKELLGIEVKIGSIKYATDVTNKDRSAIRKIIDEIKKSVDKMNGTLVAERSNNQSMETTIAIGFTNDKDRINAVKLLRKKDSEYILNVRSKDF